jgi:hypothetical protein
LGTYVPEGVVQHQSPPILCIFRVFVHGTCARLPRTRLPGGFCQTKKWLAFFVAAHHFGAHEPVLAAPAQPGKLDFLIGEWRSSP